MSSRKQPKPSTVTDGTPAMLDVIIGTSLGAGFCPLAPGTAGAAAGVLLWLGYACLLPYTYVLWLTVALILLFTAVSIAPIDRLERFWGADPKRVVIDETVGVWITLLAVPSTMQWYYVVAAFVLFRLMDILKPLGCRWLDKNVHGGWGVMLDDILAGIYGALVICGIRML